MIPFLDLAAATAEVRAELDAAVARVLDANCYLLGPETEAFEREFAAVCGAAHGVGVASGYDALEIALRSVGVTAGDEVVVPSHTFAATWLAVCAIGAVPVPVEPRTAWSGIDAEAVAAAIGPRTAAVLPVHMHGHPADVAPIAALARAHGLAVVEDAAQAHGATVDGRPVGRHADAVAYSFYPGKNVGAFGDGGALVTDRRDVAERARAVRNYGSTRKYEHDEFGRNSRLDELQAALLRVKLRRLAEWNRRRRTVAGRYAAGLAPFADAGVVTLPPVRAGTEPSWHLYSVLVADRDGVRGRLAAAGVQTGVHYPVPLHRAPAFAHLDRPAGSLPVAEHIAAHTLSLPIGPHLPPADADAVVAALGADLASGSAA